MLLHSACQYQVYSLYFNQNYHSFFIHLDADGKAGMAVVIDNSSASIDMNTLATDLKKYGLPPYARPCFIRLTEHIELTGSLSDLK